MKVNDAERIFISPPHMCGSELAFIEEAFASNYIAPAGPMLAAFEHEFANYTGIEHCAALVSGTAAMHLALRNLDISAGDEVFCSTLTFIGSVSPLVFCRAIPVFIDCDFSSWNMDPELLAEELSKCMQRGKLPKAVVPTDLYGQCANYERIVEICAHYDIPVVVDAAEAVGATFEWNRSRVKEQNAKPCNSSGNPLSAANTDLSCQNPETTIQDSTISLHAGKGVSAAVFSFNGNKILTTSGGGMLASDNEEMIVKARFLAQQARDCAPHYEHSEIGFNYRMSNILAAIGRGQLQAVDARVRRKREIFEYYRESLSDLPGIEFMPEAPYGKCNRWLTVLLINPEQFGADRETVRLAMEAENIEARPVWKPMHLQPAFAVMNGPVTEQMIGRRCCARAVGGHVAEELFKKGLCLPSGTAMDEQDLLRVTTVIRRVHANSDR